MTGPRRFRPALPARFRGPWRIAVVEGSMRPAIEPGDWLIVDPTVARWPRRGTIVAFREPGSDVLALKRVAARPGDWVPFADAWLKLGPDEAWLVGDATDEVLGDDGFGPAVDSRRYGPVPVEALVARAWFRYWPARRLGLIGAAPTDLLARGRGGRIPVPGVPGRPGQPASGAEEVEPTTLR